MSTMTVMMPRRQRPTMERLQWLIVLLDGAVLDNLTSTDQTGGSFERFQTLYARRRRAIEAYDTLWYETRGVSARIECGWVR